MRTQVLVDAAEFWERLKDDLRDARERVYVQTFSFEGDRVGTALGRALERCRAIDRRLLVDGFSLLYHNDRLIPGPAWLERPFRREVKLTHRWVSRLRDGGARVKFGNPIGPWPLKLVRRNHKKLVVIDDRISYFGGINFSEHNFEWHDVMFRVECSEFARVLAGDFRASWDGRPQTMDEQVGPFRVLSLNGRGNSRMLRPVLEAIAAAQRSIDVMSAYLSHPFTHHLAAAQRRGTRVRVLTPAANNKSNLARHILQRAHRDDFDVFRFPGVMSHMKAMLIDDELLVAGSSNFDFMSYHILEEIIVMTRDPATVESFVERVWIPDLAGASQARVHPSIGTWYGDAVVHLGAAVAGALARP